jgi:PST family polysaccharide transporter
VTVGDHVARGAAWMLLYRLGDRLLGVISTVVLARLLVPGDFGVLAMAMSVIGLLEIASTFGLEVALIQRKDARREHYDTVWTLNLIFAGACGLAMLAAAYPAAVFYAEPRLVPVIATLAGAWSIQALENIGVVDFRKRLEFRRDFLYLSVKRVAQFVIVIILARVLSSYWALVLGIFLHRIFGVAISYIVSSYRPRLSLAAKGDLLHFSSWMFVNNLIGFANQRFANFVVGRVAGPTALGIYTVSSEISSVPTVELVMTANRAVFAGYAHVSHEPQRLRAAYQQVLGSVALFVLPAAVGLACVAPLLVQLVLGAKWSQAAPMVAILALSGGLFALGAATGSVLLALGRVHQMSMLTAIRCVLIVGGMSLLIRHYGMRGAALSELTATAVYLPLSFALTARPLAMSIGDFLGAFWRPGAATLAMYLALGQFESRWGEPLAASTAGLFRQLGLRVGLGALLYTAVLIALWFLSGSPRESAERGLIDRIRTASVSWRKR